MNNEDLEKEIELRAKEKETYAKARAEAETKEISIIAQDTNKTLQMKLNNKLATHIETDQVVTAKVEETANKLVDKGLKVQEKKVDKELKEAERAEKKAEFELEEDQYRAFGQDIAPSQIWKKKMITIGNNFWFVVIFVICFFSLAPFYNFAKVIKTQSGVLRVVAIVTGVLMVLAMLGGITYFVLTKTGAIH